MKTTESLTTYRVRRFEEGDREGFCRLYGEVFGTDPAEGWFEWKYGANPYVDDPAIFVALYNGDVVGARAFFALPMATGESTRLALQPSDAMVHPDHRREGLFSRMTREALAHYERRDLDFCFNFPNHRSLPGNLKLGWEVVGELPTYYRIHDPTAFVDAVPRPLDALVRRSARAGYRAYDALGGTAEIPVEHHDTPPVQTLADLYRQSSPDGIHARRDEGFYEWRLSAPGRRYEAFLARRDGDPTAAIVVGTETRDGVTTTRLLDALAVGEESDRHEAYAALLSAAIERREDADVVAARGRFPTAVLREFGFVPDTKPPLSPVTSTTTMVARPVGDAPWVVDGHELREGGNWDLTFAELDTS